MLATFPVWNISVTSHLVTFSPTWPSLLFILLIERHFKHRSRAKAMCRHLSVALFSHGINATQWEWRLVTAWPWFPATLSFLSTARLCLSSVGTGPGPPPVQRLPVPLLVSVAPRILFTHTLSFLNSDLSGFSLDIAVPGETPQPSLVGLAHVCSVSVYHTCLGYAHWLTSEKQELHITQPCLYHV